MQTVLLIDDECSFQQTLSQLLVDEGWEVLEASDGDAGLALARERRPAIVICDLLMPRCNGFQVCRAIQSDPASFGRPKIIVTSGSAYASDRQNAIEAGADLYLVKPVNPVELSQAMARLTGAPGAVGNVAPQETSRPPGALVRFWGVRGSIPTPGPSTVYYGGNTSCVEVRTDDEIIILDAGSGIRPLGLQLVHEFKDRPLRATLLLSHTHWDHIQGFPFFVPAYDPRNQLRIMGYDGARKGLERTFSNQMESPYFPISLQQMPGNIRIHELKDLEFEIGRVQVRAAFMNHPGVCMGYRLFTDGGSIAYLPDNELYQRFTSSSPNGSSADLERLRQFARQKDEKLIEFVDGSDVLIVDSQYDAVEYASHVGWGHSCVDDTVSLALRARVKRLFLFHHDPSHSDDHISRMVAHARSAAAEQASELHVDAAREGLEIHLPHKSPVPSPSGG